MNANEEDLTAEITKITDEIGDRFLRYDQQYSQS